MKNRLLVLLCFTPSFLFASFDGLVRGVGVNDDNLSTLAQTSWEYAKSSTTQKKFDDGFAKAFLREKDSSDLYSLSRSNTLYLTDFDTREVKGNWPLTRWPHHTGFEYNEPFFQYSEQAQEGGRYWMPE
ncbi:MAG: hypothetical protein P8X79_23140, partial [Reinekea sp.]